MPAASATRISIGHEPDTAPGQTIMNKEELTFAIKSIRFDETYRPAESTRVTTNFANLARGTNRQDNLRKALTMIDNRFNALADWDNPKGDRYAVDLDIISVEMTVQGESKAHAFPMIEVLKTTIIDRQTGTRIDGILGNNFSSYVRDYDFSILLPEHHKQQTGSSLPADFGELHGKLFRHFLKSSAYKDNFHKQPVICLSVSSSKIYHRTQNHHPILGVEYRHDESSPTDEYFAKMGLQVRYFMPRDSVAPLAFYFMGDLLADYSDLELIGTIAAMETFQKIYRPEIYNANSVAAPVYQPSLKHQDYSLTQIVYDREERSRLAVEQGKFAEEHFMKPYKVLLEAWSANNPL